MKISEEYKPLDADAVITAFKKLLKEINKNPRAKQYKYKGPEITHHCILASSFNVQESIDLEGMVYAREHGRDALTVALWKLFQLGYQQGYGMRSNDLEPLLDLLQSSNESLRNSLLSKKIELNPQPNTDLTLINGIV